MNQAQTQHEIGARMSQMRYKHSAKSAQNRRKDVTHAAQTRRKHAGWFESYFIKAIYEVTFKLPSVSTFQKIVKVFDNINSELI